MTPGHVLDLVDDYLHDLLTADRAASVERHCADCPICKVALDEARQRRDALEAHAPAAREASEEMIQMTLRKISDYDGRCWAWRRAFVLGSLGAVAAAAAVLVGFQLYFQSIMPSGLDLRVLGQTQLLVGSEASLRVQLIKRFPGETDIHLYCAAPVQAVLRQRATNQAATLAEFTTDAWGCGAPRFRVPDWADGDYELHVTARYPHERPETVVQPVRIVRSWQVMLTSDKPVYQPGQTVRVRSLALRRPDLKPVAGEGAVFTVTDPKGTVIFKKTAKNSAYGIASADCELANEILEGPYTVACKVGDTESRLVVEVRRYVLPKFGVNVTLDKPYYAVGDVARATVAADYFFGKPVAGGSALVEVQAPEIGRPLLKRETLTLDAAGKATFILDLDRRFFGRPQDSGDARLSLQVQVTDAAGQQHGRSASVLITARPLRLEIIPEGGTLVRGVVNKVYVFASYADGRPAKVIVDGPFGGKVTTDEQGAGSFEFEPGGNHDSFVGRFLARDDKGLTAEQTVNLRYGTFTEDFVLRTDKAVYAGGEKMTLTALGGGIGPVFVDLIKDGQTMLTQTIDVKDGRGELTVDLPPELSGTLQLCAYRMNVEGVPVRKTRVLYVKPAAGLDVKATLDRPEYRPGETAKLRLELRGKDCKAVPGAVSLAAVDEAVFNVLPQRPGMESVFYTLEKELLEPVYALYPWAPDLTTSAPLEQALFARTARDVPTGGPHTLVATTYQPKVEQFEHNRSVKLRMVRTAWTWLVVAVGLLGYIAMWVFVRPLWPLVVLTAAAFPFLCLGAMMFIGVGAARLSPMAEMAAGGAKMAAGADMPPPMSMAPREAAPEGGAPTLRVRQEFPETLLWRPEVITDDEGRAALDIGLADSITTWRLTGSAVAADGRLGAVQTGIKVFQPFFVDLNLPVALTRGDEVALPVVVYNYLDKPQTVELTLDDADGFERLEGAGKRVELAAREVRSTSYRVRVPKVGVHHLQVTAKGMGVADAVRRAVEVVPDGRRVERVVNGTLARPAEIDLAVPANAIEGSAKLFLKVYPSSFSQLVEGLDGIFQMPSGCFEQTSSTTYPNVLALGYLKQTGKASPEVEARARQYIHLGYQRLLTFEVAGGGFDWYGRPPANRALTAYGLMEFRDMARVHDVDPALIRRTRAWLIAQRRPDGSWEAEGHGVAGIGRGETSHLLTTAYIAWAAFDGEPVGRDGGPTLNYLLRHAPETINDSYILALVANSLNALDPDGTSAAPYLERLAVLKKTTADGKGFFWEQDAGGRTAFYGAGRSGSVETTALAVLALLPRGRHPDVVRGALEWLVQQKDARGAWMSTQATVLALKVLLAGTGKPLGDDERRIEVVWNGQTRPVVIAADQAEVMRLIDLSDGLRPGTHRLTVRETTASAAGYQIALRYHVPEEAEPRPAEPLAVRVTYDRAQLTVDDTVTATALVTNQTQQTAPMVILDLPIPPGFAPPGDDLNAMVKAGTIDKVQTSARSAIVYIRQLAPGQTLRLKYRLRATMPVKVSVPPARAYEYYDTDKQGSSAPARLTVAPRRL